jgi:uncharacterized protein YuzB (UPF0349 family)
MNLKLCANNRGTARVAKQLAKEFPRLRLHIEPCLRKCGPCREMLLAVLDGETITAAAEEALLAKVRETLAR